MLDPRKQTYVRFWAWINQSPVKLTLHPNQPAVVVRRHLQDLIDDGTVVVHDYTR